MNLDSEKPQRLGAEWPKQEILDNPNDMELGSFVRRKYLIDSNKKKSPNIDRMSIIEIKGEEPESCVLCGKLSPYTFSTHIDMRHGYIEGAGQLCPNCYSRGTEHGAIAVDYNIILGTPNDMELGAKVRQLYWENKK